jgi:formylglycine-generating enzyme required for sulfatase activity
VTVSAADRPAIVRVPGGRFTMGTDRPTFPQDGEGPARPVHVAPFAIDAHAVDVARFAAFVADTGFVTDAERVGASFVFVGTGPEATPGPRPEGPGVPGMPWWRAVEGADWRHPTGPGSGVEGREDHPVVHVSWRDACAFARWSGGRLPSEAEWEYAARGGSEGTTFPWGDELEQDGRHHANVWQGAFPERDLGLDGYRGTAPVDAFEPNGFGLFCVIGNVWEWTDSAFAAGDPRRVRKGGSYLCHASYCDRYRPAARSSGEEDASAGNVGFRVAYAPDVEGSGPTL